ncbi:MAG: right-handed parallel beta-helix repeat-containing protein [Candidatus Thermoplasmatota archaeon]|nr:right-handed parallel beta-helix repeat-containing protein [Candidatus Thermoplasmatota archaeon]
MCTDYYPLWDLYEDNIYWVEEGGTGEGKIEGSPAGNLSHVVDNYDLTNATVNVKAGEYNETVENYPLTVDEENVTFNALNGTDETFLVGAGSGLCYDVDASFVSINNFTITNFSTPIFIQNADNMVAKDNRLVENSANGIYAQNSQYNTMTGNHFSDNSGEDIYLSQIYDTQVKNNEFYHSGDESIYLRYSSYNMIKNNVVGDTNMGGIYLEHSSKNQIRDNTVSNSSMGIYLKDDSIKNYIGENSINNNGQASIWIDSTGNNTINNNIISESYAGIYIISGDNNTITMNSVENSSFQGIRIDGSDNNIVDNNVVRNSTNYNGIWVKSDKSVVSHNFVYNCNYGITLYSTTNSTAHNNTVESNQMKGIRLDKSDHNEVNDNTVTDNEDGIYLSDSQFNIIFGNTAEENVNHGIFLNGVSENEVSSNTVNSNQINGIYLDDADNNTLSTNTVNTNEENGIYIEESNNVTISYNNLDSNNYSAIVLEKCEENSLSNNVMTNNGIRIRGYQLLYWNTHSIISSNEVNGKPVEYIKDQDGGSVSNDAGQVILVNSSYIDVEGQDLSSASIGLQIAFSDNNTLSGSTLSDNSLYGVYLFESQDNLLSDNSMSSNDIGIYFHLSNDNIVRNGTISNSEDIGIDTINSNENNIYHNNFESNSRHVRDNYNNIYDDGYPSGGNYWDTYDGEDRYSGSDQDLPGRDGIGDSSYSIGTNADNYPLMESWPLDDTPPVISSVEVTDISTTSVTITWDTDEDSDSMVNFSINSDLSDYSSIYQYEFVTSHLIEIEGLESNTTYYSEVLSNDTVGNKVKADNDGSYYSFTTASIPLLEITDMTSGEPTTGDSFTLEMDVNEESRVSEVFFRWGFDGSISYNESVSSSTDTWSKTINVPSDAINLSYSFHVRYDSTKWTSTDVIEIDVIDNDAPVISMQVPNAVQVNNTADFSGSDSYDNIGIVNYTWEIEEIGEFLYGSTQSYIFNMTGNYTIKLTISDEAENEASSTRNIRVLSYTPSVVEGSVVDSESNPIEGATIYFDSGENITTGSDGRFSTEVTSGNRTLTVVKTGYRNYTKEIFVENETTIDIGTIILNESVIVINYEPAGDEVPVESTIEIQYSDNIMSAEVKVSGLSGETEYSGTNVTFAPLNQMEYDTTYTVYVNATDMNGNKIDTFTWSFTTKSEDVFPSVIDYQPVGSEVPIDSIIEIQYSDDIMSVEIKVTDLSGEVKHSDANVTFTPLDPMEYDTTYTVYVNATDMDGNNLDMFTWSFTTESQDQKEYGYVEGRITDADNNSLSGATVLFDSGEVFTTDQSGFFSGQVEAGSREITITLNNYENFTDSFYIEKDQSKDFGNIVMQEIDSSEDEDEDSDSDLTGIGGSLKDNMLYMILALLIVIVLVIFILRKSSKPVKEEEELIEYKEEESTELEKIDEEEINIDPKEEGDMNSELQNEHSEDLDVEKDGDLLEKENQE